MRDDISTINFDDIPEITDFSKGRKNPFADKLKREGYTIRIRYNPEDLGQITGEEACQLDSEELRALEIYQLASGK